MATVSTTTRKKRVSKAAQETHPALVLVGAKRYIHKRVNGGEPIQKGDSVPFSAFEKPEDYESLRDLEYKDPISKQYKSMFLTEAEYAAEKARSERRASKQRHRHSRVRKRG